MFPPLQMSATRLPASRLRSLIAAASGAAPAGSARLRVPLIISSTARRISSSVTSTKVVEQLPEDALREFETDSRRESLGEGLHRGFPELLGRPGEVGGGSGFGLHGDDFDVGRCVFGDDAGAGGAASAADGDDHDVDLGLLLEDLERDGRDARDQVWLVA